MTVLKKPKVYTVVLMGTIFAALTLVLSMVWPLVEDAYWPSEERKQYWSQHEKLGKVLNTMEAGDMLVVTNEHDNRSLVLVAEEAPRLTTRSTDGLEFRYPINYPAPRIGGIRFSEILNIVGDNGVAVVIPKANVQYALKSMLGMAANFQHE